MDISQKSQAIIDLRAAFRFLQGCQTIHRLADIARKSGSPELVKKIKDEATQQSASAERRIEEAKRNLLHSMGISRGDVIGSDSVGVIVKDIGMASDDFPVLIGEDIESHVDRKISITPESSFVRFSG